MAHVEVRSRRGDFARHRRASRALSVCVALAAATLAAWIASGGAGAAQAWPEALRLRAFAPGVAGRLEAGPGRRARLVASNLPRPDVLTPDARAFVVWATAPGRVVRLGALRRGADGRAAFEFAHPPGLARYGLVVTAELSSDAARPAGAPVLSTRALEVDPAAVAAAAPRAREQSRAAAAGERATPTPEGRAATTTRPRVAPGARREGEAAGLAAGERSRICVGGGCGADAFSAEVNGALAGDGAAGRSLLLVGARGARGARGWARVANRGGTAYARVRFRRVPHPARFGARRHVLWAVTETAGPVYVGSLPLTRLNRAPAYVRAGNIDDRNFSLLVTAEKAYPAARPAGRRVMLTYKGRRRRRAPGDE
ncbi:MAG: hypothetical protein LC800_02370 [Acidobacteria bacterium]|nr:hypothetical protein [Acidobacteriota bacterium]